MTIVSYGYLYASIFAIITRWWAPFTTVVPNVVPILSLP